MIIVSGKKHGERFAKRALDVGVSSALIITLIPFWVVAAVLIKYSDRGPVFFLQERIGKDYRIFRLLKLRSMSVNADRGIEQTFGDSPEVTKFGSVIRRTKLDETPQLINVLLGDMSLVGPRPCLPTLVADFNADAHVRVMVKPGLTGLSQVSGNIFLSWEARWRLDKQYVQTQSMGLDLKILLKTMWIVVVGEKRGLSG